MIFEILSGAIIILILANVLIRIDFFKDKQLKQKDKWKSYETEVIKSNDETKPVVNENTYLNAGQIIANKQKINLLNKRIGNVENAIYEMGTMVKSDDGKDYEKVDFRIKVLEQEIDEIKNPKPKKNTFYGKENDEMENEIKSLVFNSKRKK